MEIARSTLAGLAKPQSERQFPAEAPELALDDCSSEPRLERVSDGNSEAGRPSGAEFEVIVDQVQVRLGPDEEIPNGVEAHRRSEVSQEVVAAGVIRASRETAIVERLVESQVFRPDSGGEFAADPVVLRRVDCVDIIEDRTIRLKSCIKVLARPPGRFSINAELLLEQEVAAEIQISSASHGHRQVSAGGRRCGGRGQRAYTKCCIELLRTSRA